jgi:hypothetical protein
MENLTTQTQTPTFQEMMALFAETRAMIDKNALEARESHREAKERSAETEKMLKKLGKEIGNLGNSFGKYTEGLLGPSIRKILKNQLGMDTVSRNAESLKQKTRYEIDYLGTVNGDTNRAILVEVKSNLQEKHIEQLKLMIEKFPIAFPEHKGKTVYGAIATVNYNEELKEKVLENGFYFMNIKDEVAHLDIPKDFVPQGF